MFNFRRKVTAGEKTISGIPKIYLTAMAKKLVEQDDIDASLYKKYNVKRGLRNANGTGVVVGLTSIGEVFGYETDEEKNKIPKEGQLYYRGYEISSLVQSFIDEDRFGFEETTYLLIYGDLPNTRQLNEFRKLIGDKRSLPDGFARDMILTAPSKSIMNKLARSVLALYCYDENPDDTSIPNVLRQSIDLIGYFPALVAYAYQAKSSHFDNKTLHLRNPIPELSTAENILRMLRPHGKYTELEAKVLDLSLILHAEHGGGNNSSFTTHLVSSSGTDTYSAISAAIGSLKGPKHGGANIQVINMIDDLKKNVKDITNHTEVDQYLIKVLRKQANDKSGLVYGMGHAIYTLSDPRAVMLKKMARKLAQEADLMDDFLLFDHIEQVTPTLYEAVTGQAKTMAANVDLYSGFVYSALDIPIDIATPLFATARLSGWCAHRIEELIAGKKLMRPAYVNVQSHRDFTPITKR
ncbi:MAG: citrate/2-methylcitrate synthase [Anaerovoracaceae bacterium]